MQLWILIDTHDHGGVALAGFESSTWLPRPSVEAERQSWCRLVAGGWRLAACVRCVAVSGRWLGVGCRATKMSGQPRCLRSPRCRTKGQARNKPEGGGLGVAVREHMAHGRREEVELSIPTGRAILGHQGLAKNGRRWRSARTLKVRPMRSGHTGRLRRPMRGSPYGRRWPTPPTCRPPQLP